MGNVYMEAEQIRYKGQYRNVQEALDNAGGGGGGTTVVANPEGSATADLAKLQVGTTIYGIPAEAGDISYDNTSSGMTADDVQEAIDELKASIPGVATTSAPGIVQPDGTSITIADGVISAVGGSGSGEIYSTAETRIGTWIDGSPIYRKVINFGALPNNTTKYVSAGIDSDIILVNLWGAAKDTYEWLILPVPTNTYGWAILLGYKRSSDPNHPDSVFVTTEQNYSVISESYIIIEYVKKT